MVWIALAAAALLSAAPLTPQGKLQGPYKVTKVTDGDTLVILADGLPVDVRLIGIDTPEKFAGAKLERDVRRTGISATVLLALGKQASANTAALLNERSVWIEPDVQMRDRYGRLLAYAYVEDAGGDWVHAEKRLRQLNLEIARGGWADTLTYPPNVRYVEQFQNAVREAKRQGRGMWSKAPRAPQAAAACEPEGLRCPAACSIKGNVNRKGERIFHPPGGRFYAKTQPEACFTGEAAALAAGYRRARR